MSPSGVRPATAKAGMGANLREAAMRVISPSHEEESWEFPELTIIGFS